MVIDDKAIDYVLKLLSDHYRLIWKRRTGLQRDSEIAYYNGMKRMLEMILSSRENKNKLVIDITGDGEHSLVETEEPNA